MDCFIKQLGHQNLEGLLLPSLVYETVVWESGLPDLKISQLFLLLYPDDQLPCQKM